MAGLVPAHGRQSRRQAGPWKIVEIDKIAASADSKTVIILSSGSKNIVVQP
jgi:hypothetical protein